MKYISGYSKNKKGNINVCDTKDNKTKSYSKEELDKIGKYEKIYGITDTIWFVPVSSVNNSYTEIVYTFDIINITDNLRNLINDIEDDSFRVDVTVDNYKVVNVEFYYIYKSNDIVDITNKIDKRYINYMQFFGVGIYNKNKNYELLARQFAEKYGIIEYSVKGNEMKYNVSYPKYLNNPHYTVQHIVNLDTNEEHTKKLKRFDSKGLVNRK